MTRRGQAGAQPDRNAQAFLQVFSQALKAHESGDLDGAIAAYRKALTFNATEATVYTNLGVALYAKGKAAEAVPLHEKATKLDPKSSIAFNNLGVALNSLNRFPEAVEAYAKAVTLDPNNVAAFSNHGDALTNAGRYAEAVEQLQKALWLQPDYPEAYSNLGMAYWGLGRLEQATGAFRVALAINSKLAMARKNLGIVQLLRGKYKEGWQEYDWRWAADKIPLRPFHYPLWNGQKIDGELLVWGEQGPGDEIIQASMVPDLVKHGLSVVWEADPRLVPLFQRANPSVRLVPRQNPPRDMGPNVKAHLPAATLGHFLRSDISKFPQDRRSFLEVDPVRVAELRTKLNLAPGEKLVGVSWLSKNATFGEKKSTKLSEWEEILRTPGAKFVDLQYGDTATERAALKKDLGLDVIHVEGLDLRDDFEGLAALISLCGVVVTVSNTTAHVAGALGVPTWIFVAAGGGKLWYWGADDVETPAWYPSATIIRQKKDEPWSVPLHTAAERLKRFLR